MYVSSPTPLLLLLPPLIPLFAYICYTAAIAASHASFKTWRIVSYSIRRRRRDDCLASSSRPAVWSGLVCLSVCLSTDWRQ